VTLVCSVALSVGIALKAVAVARREQRLLLLTFDRGSCRAMSG
jgi:hypothetical protein